jgi:predicted GNAT superfamily acetyltransferase
LVTAKGNMVQDLVILPFNEKPGVLIWGDRVFVDDKHECEVTGRHIYREVFSYTVPC